MNPVQNLPTHKFSVGPFQGWLVGKQLWAVRDKRSGAEIAHARNMSDCCRICERLHDNEKAAQLGGPISELYNPI